MAYNPGDNIGLVLDDFPHGAPIQALQNNVERRPAG